MKSLGFDINYNLYSTVWNLIWLWILITCKLFIIKKWWSGMAQGQKRVNVNATGFDSHLSSIIASETFVTIYRWKRLPHFYGSHMYIYIYIYILKPILKKYISIFVNSLDVRFYFISRFISMLYYVWRSNEWRKHLL